jgi:hypothetical protein
VHLNGDDCLWRWLPCTDRLQQRFRGPACCVRCTATQSFHSFISVSKRVCCRSAGVVLILFSLGEPDRVAGKSPASNVTSTPRGTPSRKLTTKAQPPGGGIKAPSPARPSKPVGALSPTDVRKNAFTVYQEVLTLAAKKLGGTALPQGVEMADPGKLAQAVEHACHTAFGTNPATALPCHPLHFFFRPSLHLEHESPCLPGLVPLAIDA